MRRRGDSLIFCSSARKSTARGGLIPGSFSLRGLDNPRLYFAGFAGGEVADLLTIKDLRVYLDVDAGTVKAVDGVSFRVPEGGTVALVGESGSGKSVVAQTIMGILPRIAHIEAGDDRDRADLPPGATDRRRADYRARRHHPGADPPVDRHVAARAFHGGAADHA